MKPTIWQLIASLVLSVGIGAGGAYAYRLIWPQQSQLAKNEMREICHGKVVYLVFDSAVLVKQRADGKPWTCGGV